MKRMDTEKQLADIEMKHLNGLLTQEQAILSRQKIVAENKEKVDRFKAEVKEYNGACSTFCIVIPRTEIQACD